MTFIPDRDIEIKRSLSLIERPYLAAHLGAIISLWSELEARLTAIFGLLAGIDAVMAMKLITAITNDGARKAVCMTLAQDVLPDDFLDELNNLFREIKDKGILRNKVAHGVWGISPQIEDAVFFTDVKNWLRWASSVDAAEAQKDGIQILEASRRWPDAIGYRESDFQGMEKKISNLLMKIEEFRIDLIWRLSNQQVSVPQKRK
ncbi:MAG: hypothetical protein ACRESI_08160 [Gammaproteobacteria bacterium]